MNSSDFNHLVDLLRHHGWEVELYDGRLFAYPPGIRDVYLVIAANNLNRVSVCESYVGITIAIFELADVIAALPTLQTFIQSYDMLMQ
jgi:hypothetical protein